MTDQQVRQIIREELNDLLKSDRYTFTKTIQVLDGRNIQTGRSNGTKIATASDQLLGFYGVTPVNRPDTVAAPTGGATQDAEARTAINSIISRLQELGLIT